MCIHMFSVKAIKQTLAIKNIKLIWEHMSSKTPRNLDNSLKMIQTSSYTVCLILSCRRLSSYAKRTQRLPKKSSLPMKKPRSENCKICVSSLISIILHQKTATSRCHQTLQALLTHSEMLVRSWLLCITLCADSHYCSHGIWGIHTYAGSMFPPGIVGHHWQLRDNNAVLSYYGFRQMFPNLSLMHKIRSSQLWLSK